jgi:hypothetical protein
MKGLISVLVGAALFIAIMTYSVRHFPQGNQRFIGFAVGTVVFAGFAFGPKLAKHLFGSK